MRGLAVGGFDSAQARFLMLTAITHHRFSSRVWGEHEVRRLYAELTEIDVSATGYSRPGAGPAPGSAAPLGAHGGARGKQVADDWRRPAPDHVDRRRAGSSYVRSHI